MNGSLVSFGLLRPSFRFAAKPRNPRSPATSQRRGLARWATAPIALLLITHSTVTGALAGQSGGVPRVASVQGLDDPPGTGSRGRGLRRAEPTTLAVLRSRWPLHGPITSGFGPRGTWWDRHFHTGVDIRAPRGTPVHTPATGVVAFAGWRSGYGRTVVIDHGHQVQTLYGHLATLDVRGGQTVGTGATIGRTGSTGHSSGPHLHYEVLVNGHPVNPTG